MPLPEDGDSTESSVYDAPSAFNPYDPPIDTESVQPTPISPTPSSDTPGTGDTGEQTESRPQGEQQVQEEVIELPKFDERHTDDFIGLLYLGRIDKQFRLFGHTFVIRTLTTEQLAEIAQIVKPYEGTSAENAVYQSAVVAASVQAVDGQPLPGSLTFNELDDLQVRFTYVMRNWMPPVREAIYREGTRLELVTRQALTALGEASG
jgi:hypothetical protein